MCILPETFLFLVLLKSISVALTLVAEFCILSLREPSGVSGERCDLIALRSHFCEGDF